MQVKPIEEQLRDSDAVRTLFDERDVAERLLQLGWYVTHGSYYSDPETTKLRELDVHARRHFREPASRRLLTINVLVEVKTMRGFHVVFAEDRSTEIDICNREWLGYHIHELLTAATAAGLSAERVAQLSALADSALAGEHHESPITGLCIDPLEAPFVGAAFRETNVGTTKELDTSVVWRGAQAIFSAVESLKSKTIDYEIRDIVRGACFAADQHPEMAVALRVALPARMRRVEIYHAIVLTNARLWKCEADAVVEVPWVRWLRTGISGASWCDVVTTDSAQDYFAGLTSHYISECTESDLSAA